MPEFGFVDSRNNERVEKEQPRQHDNVEPLFNRVMRESGERQEPGTVRVGSDGVRREYDAQGDIRHCQMPNGDSRSFNYETHDGRKQLSMITDWRKTPGGPQTEVWTRQGNADGSLRDEFMCYRDDGQQQIRSDIKVKANGDYQYSGGDGSLKLAGLRGGGPSENIQEARQNFSDATGQLLSPQAQSRLQGMMNAFESRMADRAFLRKFAGTPASRADAESEKTVANTYNHLAEMVSSNPPGAYFNQQTRARLAENFMLHASRPTTMDQGDNGTCWIQAGHIAGGMVNHSDHMARLLKEISLNGSYRSLNNGESDPRPRDFHFPKQIFSMGGEEANWTIQNSSNNAARSPVGMIFDRAMPIIGGRAALHEHAGSYDDTAQHGTGTRKIMYMVTGDTVCDSGHLLDGSARKTLLEKGAYMNYTTMNGQGHVRTMQLLRNRGQWQIVQDDQHGEYSDVSQATVADLRNWQLQPSNVRFSTDLPQTVSDDKPLGYIAPQGAQWVNIPTYSQQFNQPVVRRRMR